MFCLVSSHSPQSACRMYVSGIVHLGAAVLYYQREQALPARSFGEDNVVVIFWSSLNE